MSGPTTMYKMRPIVKLEEELELPKCMYKMKVIQISHIINTSQEFPGEKVRSTISEEKPFADVVALENRQEAILLQLSHLKEQLSSLRKHLKNSETVVSSAENTYCGKIGLSDEIVVKANPKNPPYSLLALDHLFKNNLKIQCCAHSASSDLCENLSCFERNCSCPLFNIRLIWKNVEEMEFLTSPTKHAVISSEVNLLRFLSRAGPVEFNYELPGNPTTTCFADGLLDACHQLVQEGSMRMKLALVRDFGEILKKNTFLMGERISIVDVALWSSLKQIGVMTKQMKDIPASVNKWFINCSVIFGEKSL